MLGKFVYEIDAMPADEFDEWIAYYNYKQDQERQAREDAELEARKNRKQSKNGNRNTF